MSSCVISNMVGLTLQGSEPLQLLQISFDSISDVNVSYACIQNQQGLLRRTNSDVSIQMIGKFKRELEIYGSPSKVSNLSTIDEVKQAECECCGMKEECTEAYIAKVEGFFSGKWVCGLCSEAVKERMKVRSNEESSVAVEEAVRCHRDVCQKFNSTRLNPKLSLTFAMRDIAKRSEESRNSKAASRTPKLTRRSSCVPRIN